MGTVLKKVLLAIIPVSILGMGAVSTGISNTIENNKWERICDGTSIVDTCQDEEGNRYSKYIYHEAVSEQTKEVYHPAEPAKTHVVHHPAEYGARLVPVCIKTDISYKNGSCALSQCRDGSYSGSTGRGTCSYHGGVARSGGPWYEYVEEQYLISEAWDETVIDVPAKDAWTETVIVTPAKDAWIEKELAD